MTRRSVVVLAWLIVAGIGAQAVLAGQGWFQTPSLIGLHGGAGHGVLGLTVIAVVVSLVARLGWATVAGWLVLLAGLTGQTGLGYVGRRSGVALASSLHIPLGVALFGLSVAIAVLLTVRSDARREVTDRAG